MLQRQSLDVSVAETVAGCECCRDSLWMWVLQRRSLDVSVAETVAGCECCRDSLWMWVLQRRSQCLLLVRRQMAEGSEQPRSDDLSCPISFPPSPHMSSLWSLASDNSRWSKKRSSYIYIYMDVRGKGNRSIHTLISTAVLCSLCTCENMALFGVSCIQSS